MENGVTALSKEIKDKLLLLEKVTEKIWGMPLTDPEYSELHELGKRLQGELIGHYGLSPRQINEYTYGEGGIMNG